MEPFMGSSLRYNNIPRIFHRCQTANVLNTTEVKLEFIQSNYHKGVVSDRSSTFRDRSTCPTPPITPHTHREIKNTTIHTQQHNTAERSSHLAPVST
jgi:hypothetical protein